FTSAHEVNPSSWAASNGLASVRAMQKRYDEALPLFQLALVQSQNDERVRSNYAAALMLANLPAHAAEQYRLLLNQRDSAYVWNNLATALAKSGGAKRE